MERLLKMLLLLGGKRRYTLDELKQRFDISDSTAYRYFDTFESAGFVLERSNGSYRLVTDSSAAINLGKLIHFSEEEASILYQTLSMLEGSTPAKDRLVKKLHALYDLHALAQLREKSQEEVVSRLGEAMRSQKQVLLQAYRSNNSETITDRLVEPFEFLSDYTGIWCFEVESKRCKQFKVARIAGVTLLDNRWQHSTAHQLPFVDAFRMSAIFEIARVKATLTLKAYNLLVEEYPLALAYINTANGVYVLDIPVADFNGVGRFVLGLAGEVEVLGPAEFIQFIEQRRKNSLLVRTIAK